MEFSLTDAISLKHSYVDLTHKFWGYFHLGAAATAGLAWLPKEPGPYTLGGMAIAFIVFAFFNRRLVVSAQESAKAVSDQIDRYIERHSESITEEFRGIANTYKPDTHSDVRLLHLALSSLVILLVAARLGATG